MKLSQKGEMTLEFSNLLFLYILLPLTLAVYFLMPDMRKKNLVLIATSLVFYALGNLMYLPLLLLTAFINYWLGNRVKPGNRASLLLPIALNIGVLVLFKYLNFILGCFGIVGADGGAAVNLLIPIGISYYTFQMVAYHTDIYRGKSQPAPAFADMLLFLCMFPKLPTGPIIRYEQVQKQMRVRKPNPRAILQGGVRFTVGLAKQVLIAGYLKGYYDSLSTMKFGAAAWLGALVFMLYIYFDFSGCIDMAIGLGRVFGFRYPENFDLPYTSKSITEFWRRWHITLGSFFRDYVYIPLGGNRKGKARQILNLLIVWALTGLWHGASWNFVLWGLYFFVLLVAEKQLLSKLERIPSAVRMLGTLFFVLLGWVLFANTSLAAVGDTFARMFGKGAFWNDMVRVKLVNALPVLAVSLVGASVIPRWIGFAWSNLFLAGRRRTGVSVKECVYIAGMVAFAALLLYLCTISLSAKGSVTSMYSSF